MLQRTCTDSCSPACTEKGFGIRIKDCTSCCQKEPDCGTSDLIRKKWQLENHENKCGERKCESSAGRSLIDTKIVSYKIVFLFFTVVYGLQENIFIESTQM